METHITAGGVLIAIIVSHRFNEKGIHFLTPDDLSQQLAIMRHPAGKIIEPHVHNPVSRQVRYTQEVLYLRKGRLLVDFYDENRTYLESRILECGDMVVLVAGGHGFEALEEIEMIEVKQGPYLGDQDKTRFEGISDEKVRIVKG